MLISKEDKFGKDYCWWGISFTTAKAWDIQATSPVLDNGGQSVQGQPHIGSRITTHYSNAISQG